MTIQKRSIIMGIIAGGLALSYGIVKWNSHLLVEHVVERTLIQKAPAGMDPVKIHQRLQDLLAAEGDRTARTNFLFQISQELEKVQEMSARDLMTILRVENIEILEE